MLQVKINIPVLLVLSILPDIDILGGLLFNYNIHRGPTHSIVVAALVFIPLFVIYRKKATPYFLGLASHFLIGDFIIGGQLQLLWPLSFQKFGLHELGFPLIMIDDRINIILELSLFIIAIIALSISSDWKAFFKGRLSNLVLIIPMTTVLLPSTIGYPFTESLLLTAPALALAHIFFLVLFSIAVFATLISLCRHRLGESNKKQPSQTHN